MQLTVELGKDSYNIHIEKGILHRAGEYVKEKHQGKRAVIVSDDQVWSYYGTALQEALSDVLDCTSVVIPHGEASKNFQMLPKLYEAFLNHHLSRTDIVIALGGGVVGDLTGFAAATYLRGISYIQIPTSLLAQVDSSVGGKTAVDLSEGKNLVGAFKQPDLVLIDPLVLNTLPERYIRDGMGEVIKYGCIKDARLFDRLKKGKTFAGIEPELEEIIACCVDIKRQVVQADPFDKGQRMLLNFGHTLAHAVEQYYHYERESHGEAVAVGMYQLTLQAEEKGLTKKGTAEQIREVLAGYGLPVCADICQSELLEAIGHDKKNLNQKLNLVLLKDIGESYLYQADLSFFDSRRTV